MVKLGSTSTTSQHQRRLHQQTPMTLPQLPNRPAPGHLPGSRWMQPHQSTQLDPPTYTNVHQLRSSANGMLHPIQRSSSGPQTPLMEDPFDGEWEEEQLAQLDAKHHQLGQLEKFVREEGAGNSTLFQNSLRNCRWMAHDSDITRGFDSIARKNVAR